MKKKLGLGLIAGVGLLILYLFSWPVAPKPIGVFVAPKAPPLTGTYEQNNRLQAVERFGDGHCLDPEDITVDTQGRIYASMADGRIMRFSPDGSNVELYANTAARPPARTGLRRLWEFDCGG